MKEVDFVGTTRYYDDNRKLHREDGPALIYTSGTMHWYEHGQLHREDGAAVICSWGDELYHMNGKQYSIDEFKMITFFNKPGCANGNN